MRKVTGLRRPCKNIAFFPWKHFFYECGLNFTTMRHFMWTKLYFKFIVQTKRLNDYDKLIFSLLVMYYLNAVETVEKKRRDRRETGTSQSLLWLCTFWNSPERERKKNKSIKAKPREESLKMSSTSLPLVFFENFFTSSFDPIFYPFHPLFCNRVKLSVSYCSELPNN